MLQESGSVAAYAYCSLLIHSSTVIHDSGFGVHNLLSHFLQPRVFAAVSFSFLFSKIFDINFPQLMMTSDKPLELEGKSTQWYSFQN